MSYAIALEPVWRVTYERLLSQLDV